jgi:hypothetical protein
MCKKCGFSGCNHDWRKWQPRRYDQGYDDAAIGRSANPPEGMLASSGYMAGFEQRQRDEKGSNLTQRAPDRVVRADKKDGSTLEPDTVK